MERKEYFPVDRMGVERWKEECRKNRRGGVWGYGDRVTDSGGVETKGLKITCILSTKVYDSIEVDYDRTKVDQSQHEQQQQQQQQRQNDNDNNNDDDNDDEYLLIGGKHG
ncbi:hypothetical protein M0802_003764 [Mischocyttarus mexicanus]|nr:hypothetical protein M0802_003764 [Mischocyttarus mexicanus]